MAHSDKRFRKWWKYVSTHKQAEKREVILKWLRFACKTVATRGDIDQQRIVYTINTRAKNSLYPLARYQARRVFDIVNKKQIKFKQELNELKRLERKLQPLTHDKPGVEVVIKRRTTRKTIASGGGNVTRN
jgi:hypothetical protein